MAKKQPAKESKEDISAAHADEVFAQILEPRRLERLEQVLAERTNSLTVVLDRVQNYHNISAVLRSADAFGLSEIHLIGESFEYSKGITLGTERWMQLTRHHSPEEAAESLRALGYSLVILQPEEHAESKELPPSIPITALPFEKRLALIFGNERDGVSEALSQAAHIHAFIPMKGFVESLNISVACAICLFCSTLAPTNPEKRTCSLTEEESRTLRSQWLRKGVKRSDIILRQISLDKTER